jgi:Ion channel
MLTVTLTALLLIAVTTLMHYEVLRALHVHLPGLPLHNRSKLLIAIFCTVIAHLAQVALYGLALYVLVNHFDLGRLEGPDGPALGSCMFFSAESYTSLGFGDIKPTGPIRLITGVEALNGLLLIGWSACYLYVAMERLWMVSGASERA